MTPIIGNNSIIIESLYCFVVGITWAHISKWNVSSKNTFSEKNEKNCYVLQKSTHAISIEKSLQNASRRLFRPKSVNWSHFCSLVSRENPKEESDSNRKRERKDKVKISNYRGDTTREELIDEGNNAI